MNENENQVMEGNVSGTDVTTEATQVTEAADKGPNKLLGFGVIGFAIGGLVWLILSIIKGVKFLIGKFKKPKEEPKQEQKQEPKQEPEPEEDYSEFVDDGPIEE